MIFRCSSLVLLVLYLYSSAAFVIRTTRTTAYPSRCRARSTIMAASSTGSTEATPCVLGLGVCGIDLLAYVDKYPKADQKLRTSNFQVQGGGNAGNTLTGLNRLGVKTAILTKVGDDAYGTMICDELSKDGVDTHHVVRKKGISSPFTYVIVDMEGQTRTCIHTPSEDVLEEEIHPGLLDGVTFLHLDSRNTRAAINLAKLARERKIPIMLDAEKDRPHLGDLVPLCDYITTNTVFPKDYTGSQSTEEGMVALLEGGEAKIVVTTLGAQGSMVMGRKEELEAVIKGGVEGKPDLPLATSVSTYSCPKTQGTYEIIKCAAWPVNESEIVDTTGAGDSFISGMIYGLSHGLSIPHTLNIASFIASQKLKAPGARAGLPKREDFPQGLLP